VSLPVVALVLLPVVVTVGQAFGGAEQISSSLQGTDVTGLLLHTLLVAVLVTPLCGILGVAAAWLTERTDLPGRRIWALLLVAPVAIPLFVTSYAWADLGPSFQGLLGAVGIVAFTYYPIVYLLACASLRGMDPALEELARSLGCGGWQTFWRVVFPQLCPALLGGLLVVALDTLVEFDAFVGIHYSLFITNIYDQYRVSFSASGAAALACVSIAVCVVVLAVEAKVRGNRNYVSVTTSARRRPSRYRLGRSLPAAAILMLVLVAIAVGIPVAALLRWAGQATPQALASAPAPASALWPAAATSIGLGVAASLLALALALPVALLATRYRGVAVTLIERATYLSFALPDFVAAIAIAYATSQIGGILVSNVAVLVFAYAILFCPIAVLALRVSFGQVDPRLDEAARSLGRGPVGALAGVGLPLARPGIAAAGVLVFAFVLSDLSTTQALIPSGMLTLGTQFEANAAAVAFGAATPYAAALMVLAAAATYVLMSRFGRTRLATS
jgi:iron(III) transport system permease protein